MASDGETSCANDPNFAVIYSFLKVFGKLYGLEVPTIAKLQEFIENTQEVSETIKELHLRLLRRALKTVHSNRWEKGMIKFCHQQGHHQEAWEIERFTYKKASTQVKLKVLKILLEYQFTCHPKFKNAVNAISCKELRLEPIGRDKNGCVYWLQVDDDANLCLYKEDQDEETWQLIARNREELVKVIAMLKNGEEINASNTSNVNEDSSGAENLLQESLSQTQKPEVEEDDNEEEFLSPESESEQELDTDQKDKVSEKDCSSDPIVNNSASKLDSLDPLDNNEQINENIVGHETQKKIVEVPTENDSKLQDNNTTEAYNVDDPEIPSANTSEIHSESENESETKQDNINLSHIDNNVISGTNIADTPKEKVAEEEDENKIEELTEEKSEGFENMSEKHNLEDTTELNQNIAGTQSDNTIKRIKEEEGEEYNSDPEIESTLETETEGSPGSSKIIEISKDSEIILNKEVTAYNSNIIKECDSDDKELGEAIEEPVMLVTGEGSGADCESYFLGEEIVESVMYFYGEGYGYDNDTGNPEVIEDTHEAVSDEKNGNQDVVNGEHEAIKTKGKLSKSVRLKSVNKRALKKQPNDTNDAKPDTKKPCVRVSDKPNNSKVENDLKTESSLIEKESIDSEPRRKNNVKKGRSKVKKRGLVRKIKTNGGKEAINSLSETDKCQDKTSIIEKRKSSVSSEDQDNVVTDCESEKSPIKELKIEDPLPNKKLRLETTPESDVNATHSKEAVADSAEDKNSKSIDDSISKRKKIKASKGKFKRKTAQKKEGSEKNNDVDRVNSAKKKIKSLKRSLMDDPLSDKNKTESQSESEDDEPITSGKRLKIKPKKIITSSRKKVEAKIQEEKHSSDESEEETLYSLAGKKTAKKLVKKKPKLKSKDKKQKTNTEKAHSDESDTAPVRQSRRIAQQKIKEEAERRNQEEVALRELKIIHKKKTKDDEEEEWVASGHESSVRSAKNRRARSEWRASDSTGTEPDSESDSPLFDLHPEPEPDLEFGKSDHEFSPESDLESGEQAEPLKLARTLQEEKEEGHCQRCGSSDHPAWILLCDCCDGGYHASCLRPRLLSVPAGDWFCPSCSHDRLIGVLETELVKYDELLVKVEEERARKKLEEPEPPQPEEKKVKSDVDSDASGDSSWSSSSGGAVYRLRARRQLPVSYRSQEYDRIISAAIKEEYVEPTTSAGNQGRGKDISTIIEAAEEEKMKAEREAIEQGKPVELIKKLKKKQRRKPRKLNSLDVPSEDDDETDEDFKDTGAASSSEDISSSADREGSCESRSSDSLPIRRTGRHDKKDRIKMRESSPETKKKKKGAFGDNSSSESAGAKEWAADKPKPKSKLKLSRLKRRDKSKKSRKERGLTQYDAEGNVIRARVTYGGLSGDDDENDWSPKHRTRQKKINYTEMPNTESEDEMHKSSGKHMPESSDEFKISESEYESDSDAERAKKRREEENLEREKALSDLVKKTAVVPLEKLPEDVTRAKTEELQAHLSELYAQAANARPSRGKGSRGGRGSRSGRGRGSRPRPPSPQVDEALAKLVGVKIKELGQDGIPPKPSQVEREKKRQEREAKLAEKEAKRAERIQKKEEKEKLKEQKAKEREEKKLARLAIQESKRIKKEKDFMGPVGGFGPRGPDSPRPMFPTEGERFPAQPRLQVRAELRGVLTGEHRQDLHHPQLREGTLSVAGSPQPFKPVSEEPSIITRMPHIMTHQYRAGMVYPGGYPAGMRYPAGLRYPPHYYRLPPYPAADRHRPGSGPSPMPPSYYRPGGPHSPPGSQNPYMARSPGPPNVPSTSHQHIQGPYLNRSPGPSTAPYINRSPGPVNHNPLGYVNRSPGPPSHPGHYINRSPGPVPVTSGPFLNRSPGPVNNRLMGPNISGPRMPGVIGPGSQGNLGPGPGIPIPATSTASELGPNVPPGGSQDIEPPIKIKAEVKTEPEYRSPVASPGAASPPERAEPPRHPKIKVTERRPRFPLGPYAPHLAPYRPYAPAGEPAQFMERTRSPTEPPSRYPGPPRPFMMRHMGPHGPTAGTPPRHFPFSQLHMQGQPPHSQSPHLQHQPHGPPFSQSPHGQQPHGQPHSQPHHGQSPQGQTLHGQPSHGQPPHGQSTHNQPAHGQPSHSQQPHAESPLGQSSHSQLTRGQQSHSQSPHGPLGPPHGQPYNQSPHGQSSQGQPPQSQTIHSQRPHAQSPHLQSSHGPHGQPIHLQSLHLRPQNHGQLSHQPSLGQSPQSQSPHGQSLHSQPPHGQSPQSQAPHGHQANSQPRHGHPSNIQLRLGHPMNNQQPHGHNPNSQPPHGHNPNNQPPHGHPANNQPPQGHISNSQPPHGQQLHSQPPHGHPSNSQPLHRHPLNNQSPHGHPSNSQSPHGHPPNSQLPHRHPLNNHVSQGHPLNNQAPQGHPLNNQAPLRHLPNGQAPQGHSSNNQPPHGHPQNSQPLHRQLSSPNQQPNGQPTHNLLPQGQQTPQRPLPSQSPAHSQLSHGQPNLSQPAPGQTPSQPVHSQRPQARSPLLQSPHHSQPTHLPPQSQPLHSQPRPQLSQSPRAQSPPALSPHESDTGPRVPSPPINRAPVQFPPQLVSQDASPRRMQTIQGSDSPPSLDRVKIEKEEGGVFGGLVSYFSSQHEDDIDN